MSIIKMNKYNQNIIDMEKIEKIKSSNMYLTGEVLNEKNNFSQLEKMLFSTFDLSKFEVVGTPTITDSGVASGFEGVNYLKSTALSSITPSSTWEFVVKFNLETINYSSTRIILGKEGFFRIDVNQYNQIQMLYVTSNTIWGNSVIRSTSAVAEINKDYWAKASYNGSVIKLEYSTDGVNYTLIGERAESSGINSIDNVYIGGGNDANKYCAMGSLFKGSIDLNDLSIVVDGQKVNYTQTGLDIIKADNYEVVGTPTISEDGIYTCSDTTGNYIKIPIDNTANNFSLDLEINIPDITQSGYFLGYANDVSYGCIDANFNGVEQSDFRIRVLNENSEVQTIVMGISKYKTGIEKINLTFTGTQYILTRTKSDGTIYTNTVDSTYKLATNFISLGKSNKSDKALPNINLNTIKIYIDGKLTYQPCLKIPYNLSKTGSKIVDVQCRNRVQDVYEQYGQAQYYTIDRLNKDFTLPMGEIYGMLNKTKSLRRLIEVSDSSLMPSYYEIYEQQNLATGKIEYYCIQGGKATSSNITLLKPYKDTNYNILLVNNSNAQSQLYGSRFSVKDITETGFKSDFEDTKGKYWRTEGYIDYEQEK